MNAAFAIVAIMQIDATYPYTLKRFIRPIFPIYRMHRDAIECIYSVDRPQYGGWSLVRILLSWVRLVRRT